ncbi:MAG TPA: DUF2461 domain-containing protein [Bryobacteraceae bacterium]|jgi:uncharacterized protein (TIGR02453 family)|nr:DUF2461 domain-containing protein [Bryobacteraceae bacterium]
MKSTFPGLPQAGMAFLRSLKKNNNREWFNPRKDVFDDNVRQPMLALVSALHREMLRFAPEYVGDPAKCIYRIYRDTRFSKNKTPYKTYTSALLWRNGFPKDDCASYYFGISPEGIDVGGGVYSPEPESLLAVRQHIAADPAAFRATFENRKVKKLFGEISGSTLSRVPKGFDPAHPAADLLKHKQYILWAKLDPALATTPKLFVELATRFEAMTPFIDYLNLPLLKGQTKQKREERFMRDDFR